MWSLDVGSRGSRRTFLRLGAAGALGLSLGDFGALRARVAAAGAARNGGGAKSVIVLWLWGGPSHLDTFDMKPEAPIEYRGPFEPIETNVPGIRVCELFPRLARHADKFSVIRSMRHQSNDHGVAGTIALTGSIGGSINLGGQQDKGALRPSTGSIVSRVVKDRERARGEGGTGGSGGEKLPPYVILGGLLHQGHKRVVGEGGGSLGAAHDPFRLDYRPGEGLVLPNVELPENLGAERLSARWNLRGAAGGDGDRAGDRRAVEEMERHYRLARELIGSRESLRALDATDEPEAIRRRYGDHRFGRCCLIARRLVESGLPFVQVNWSTHVEGPEDAGDGGWDMHDRYFQVMQERHGWMLDQSLTALLEDLENRGLLQETLVVAVGEFGRTPRINEKAGRDHWNDCYSALLAGGGIRGGRLVGASDKRGEYPTDRPTTPADLGATLLHQLGITTTDLTTIGLTPSGSVIHELL